MGLARACAIILPSHQASIVHFREGSRIALGDRMSAHPVDRSRPVLVQILVVALLALSGCNAAGTASATATPSQTQASSGTNVTGTSSGSPGAQAATAAASAALTPPAATATTTVATTVQTASAAQTTTSQTIPAQSATTATTAATTSVATTTPATLSWAQISAKLTPSTVLVKSVLPASAVSPSGLAEGTGIVIDTQGDILTNAHVVQGASSISIALAGATSDRPARVLGSSTCDDLAVIRAETPTGLVPVTFGTSSSLEAGQDVGVVGYALGVTFGTSPAITRGIVSRTNVQYDNYESLFQTDAAINHGNSGGPVVTTDGNVVGIATLTFQQVASNTNFAINIDAAKPVIQQLLAGKNVMWLGMNLVYNAYGKYFGTQDGQGLVVAGVDAGGPADKVGVQPAFLLYGLAGTPVNTLGDVCKILRSHTDGDSLRVNFLAISAADPQQLAGDIVIGPPHAQVGASGMSPRATQRAAALPTKARAGARASGDRIGTASAASATGPMVYAFAQDDGDWPTGTNANVTAAIANNTYAVSIKSASISSILYPNSAPSGADQSIDTMFTLQGSEGDAGVAVRFSNGSDNQWTYYACDITPAGQYFCWAEVDGKDISLQNATTSPAIKKNAANELKLSAIGTKIDLQINGTDVASFTDSSIASGTPALVIESGTTPPAGATFSQVTMVAGTSSAPTPTPSPTPNPSPTSAMKSVTYDFSKDDGDWKTGQGSGYSATIANNIYAYTLTQANNVAIPQPQSMPSGGDQSIDTTVTLSNTNGIAGVDLRDTVGVDGNNSMYMCAIVGTGSYSCWLDSDGQFTALQKWTASPAIKPSGANELTMSIQGSSLDLKINGTDVAQLSDAKLTTGSPSLFVESFDTVPFTAAFGKVTVQVGNASSGGQTAAQTTVTYDFSKDDGDWATGTTSDYSTKINANTLIATETAVNSSAVMLPKSMPSGTDQSIDTTLVVNNTNGFGGVVVRYGAANDGSRNFYMCGVTANSQYSCWVSVNGKFTNLQQWTQSSAIKANGPNELTLSVQGSQLDFKVNGTDLVQLSDTKIASGQPGLYIELDTAPSVTLTFGKVVAQVATTSASASPFTTTSAYAFAKDDGDWPTGQLASATAQLAANAYAVTEQKANFYTPLVPKSMPSGPQESIDTNLTLSGPTGAAGVMTRFSTGSDNQNSFYLCIVESDGYYSCWIVLDGQFTPLQKWVTSSAFKPNAVNEVALTAIGSTIDFKMNGTDVGQFTDSQITSGQPGLYVEAFDKPPITATFGATTAKTGSVNSSQTPAGTVTYDFSKDDGDWTTGKFTDSTFAIANGIYAASLTSPNIHDVLFPKSMPSGTKETISTTVTVSNTNGVAGVAARYTQTGQGQASFYMCAITADGYFGCWVVVNNAYTSLQNWTQSPAITVSAANVLTLTVTESNIGFNINGTDVAHLSDKQLTSGEPGLYVEVYKSPPFSVVFGKTQVHVSN